MVKVKKQTGDRPPLVDVVDPTDDVLDHPAGTMPELRGMSARTALRTLAALNTEVEIVGHGRVVGQTPAAREPVVGPVRLTLEAAP
jgi:hypothetical protein